MPAQRIRILSNLRRQIAEVGYVSLTSELGWSQEDGDSGAVCSGSAFTVKERRARRPPGTLKRHPAVTRFTRPTLIDDGVQAMARALRINAGSLMERLGLKAMLGQ